MTEGPLVVACLRHADPAPGVDPLTGEVTRDAGRARASASDAAALEHALRVAEAWSGRVLALAAGPPAADATLREAAAVGAKVMRVAWPPEAAGPGGAASAPADATLEPLATYLHDLVADERGLAVALATAARAAGEPALVLCGDRSPDRGTGALPVFLAHELGAAQALGLVSLREADGELVGERRLDAGRRERLRIAPPAVCSVEAAGVRLRRAPLAAARAAARAVVPVAEPAPAPARPVTVRHVRAYRPRTREVAPPAGDAPRERLLALTGALVAHDPPTIVGPVEAGEAADALLAFLRRTGYLGS